MSRISRVLTGFLILCLMSGCAVKNKDIVKDEVSPENDKYGSFIDARDGKAYKTVRIGNQVWMAENLAFKAEKGCWAYDNDESNVATYGYLYDWETACKVCPEGWHLPSDEEWKQLEMALGMSRSEADKFGWRGSLVGTKMKNTSGWKDNGNGTNESGFAGLPGGWRGYGGYLLGIGYGGGWWSSTGSGSGGAWGRVLGYNVTSVNGDDYDKQSAFSVRCVKD